MSKNNSEKFNIQDKEYYIPYHHLVNFQHFSNAWIMPWGQEYFTYVKKVFDLSKKYNPKSIIDIGCGDGKVGFELEKIFGNKVKNVGVDLSERAILLAKALNWGNRVEFFNYSISEISGQFDMALLIEVLEHISDHDLELFVNEVRNKIVQGGILIVTVPSDCIPVTEKHYRHYNKNLLEKNLIGFELLEIHYLVKKGLLFEVLNRLIRKFSSITFIRNVFFNLYQIFCAKGNKKSHQHIVAVYKRIQ